MRLATVVTAAVALIVIASSYAQTTAESQNKCTLAGTVLDAISQQPLRGAVVFARAVQASVGSASASGSTVTDADGQFKFEDLAPGRYLLSASHDGYVNQGAGTAAFRLRLFDLAAGQHLDDVLVELSPAATISGHIFSGTGKALSGVTVNVLGRSYRFRKSEFREVASSVTDKAGSYRLTALPAGNYYLRAIPRQQSQKNIGPNLAYVPAYFPATPDQSGSTALVLRPGEQLAAVDIALHPVHTVTVRGRVLDRLAKTSAVEAELTLVEEGSVVPWPYQATVDSKGNFEMPGVPAGNYVLLAQRPAQSEKDKTMWGQKAIKVGDVDLRNVEVTISAGAELSGRISVEESSVDLSRLVGALEPGENSIGAAFTPESQNAAVSPDGGFVFHDVPEGSYRINFFPLPTGFYLKTARPAEILDSGITITQGQSLQGIEVVLSPGAARIEGTVLQDQAPALGAVVVLVPEAARRDQPRYYRQTVADRLGRFLLQNIIPGDYRVFACKEIDRGVYTNPEFLQQFADRGKTVSLTQGASINIQLPVASLE
jgi:uncharacterized protein (DUF2141 family)